MDQLLFFKPWTSHTLLQVSNIGPVVCKGIYTDRVCRANVSVIVATIAMVAIDCCRNRPNY